MTNEEFISHFNEAFSGDILGISRKGKRRITVTIRPESITAVAVYLFHDHGFRFVIASAMHTAEGFGIYYHFSKDSVGLILNIHVLLDHVKPQIESLSNMFSASNWIEREMHELFGIDFLNHPNQEKLISEGNWADGVFPYRKNFDQRP